MKAKQVRKLLNITSPTLSKYFKTGLIKAIVINKYHYQYNENDVYKLIGLKTEKKKRKIVSYSRVSTSNQKQQLIQQTNRIYQHSICKNLYLSYQYSDIASGMQFIKRKNFLIMLNSIIRGQIQLVIIENKDRLVRFGFQLLQHVFKYYGTKIYIINDLVQNKTYQQQLTQDLVSIIHHFSMKMYSNRRKLNKMIKQLQNNGNNKTSNKN